MKIIDACFAPFRRRSLRSLAVVLALLLTAAALLSTGTLPLLAQSTVQEPAAQGDGDGAVYTVQRGDSWSTVAEATGVSVAALKEANPDAVRATDWLIVGEELFIPAAAADETTEPSIYTVESGESWNSIAAAVGLTAAELKAANPLSVRTGDVLYVGERLVIPSATGEAAADAEATATPTATPEPDAGGNTGPSPLVPPRQLTRQPTATPAALPTRSTSATPESAADATPLPTEEAVEEPAAEETTTEEPAAGATDTAGQQTYVVQAGESWNSIAAKLGIAAQALR
ncbi:MAG: LysM peptidoglycan-binding domain-containing protein, partial [Caldilineaceae bacterium]